MEQTAWILFILLCGFIVLPILLIFKDHDLVLPYVTEDRKRRLERAYDRLASAGAHYVIDGIWEVPRVIDDMNRRVVGREKP